MRKDIENKNCNKQITINLVNCIKILLADKRYILIYIFIAGILGLIVAFTTPKTYKSTVMLAPEESGAGFSGSISSLASMVGMNMKIGQSGDALYPEIYPDLVSSTDFIVGLFNVKIRTKDNLIMCDYYTYLKEHQKKALMDWPLAALSKVIEKFTQKDIPPHRDNNKINPFWLTKDEANIAKATESNINCTVDKKTSVITISVTDQDPLVAALMADSVKAHLQIAITNYKTKKARVDLKYMEKLFDEARKQYDKARQQYGAAADADMDVSLQSYKLKTEDLENDMQLKYNIYQQVVEQLQLAQAKVQEKTPAFTVVQSASVPIRPSSRSKIMTIFIWMFLGFIVRATILGWNQLRLFIAQ